ncbi:hypothetical protein Acy02nite_10330 [Actinoplanes cyaneus]|uniref:Uncharacterized protein n=1 Tax=Actinoplanes cyaneus TaxID=52696 RepID=A0A919IEZ0_9ACTN|nr:hypothetical protein [Actinoplanes cyaneus]MCW2137102.1 hypothetical protein [Actinoplanes cyaneus]GID63152.1 hypothetical protein Acy02nite_10330 [Actinoplanes cyaneus]
MSTPAGDGAVYFGRLRAGDAISDPSWVLRRTSTGDEILGRDGRWRRSDMLARAERGELPGTLEPLGPVLPGVLVTLVQRRFHAAWRTIERQQAGEFTLRLAVPGTGSAYERLDDEARAETARFLRRAPLVASGEQGNVRTDGMWVWPETIAQQVLETGEPPEDEFFYHIRARAFLFPGEVAPSVIERARALLAMAAAPDGRVREANVPGREPPPTREERQRALSAWHAEWTAKHAPSTPFRPENHPGDPDYAANYVDVEASPEAEREYTARAREIMGLDPETGERTDL